MEVLSALLLLTAAYPWVEALRGNWTTTLRHALWWALLAWLAWLGVTWVRLLRPGGADRLAAYGALCLSGCAGVAVLGARRPGVSAWNFVVVGLLAVLLLPLLNGMGELRLEPAHEFFLTATLLASVLNYLPTRLGPAAVAAAAGWGWEMLRLLGWISPTRSPWLGPFLLGLAPWSAWIVLTTWKPAATELDRLWLAYRDRFGLLWGQRMREQFNRAAHRAGWSVELHWNGLHATAAGPAPDPAALLMLLRAVLKRFELH